VTNVTLEQFVGDCLNDFHARRLARVKKLTLKSVLKRKNPYLYRALGIERCTELVERLVDDHLSASDEAIFADAFFKPIALFISEGEPSKLSGIDFLIEERGHVKGVMLRSGPNVLNSSQKKKQQDDFEAARARLSETGRELDALLGHAYGQFQTEPKPGQSFRDRSGQLFWEELTGEPQFYQTLVVLIGDTAIQHREVFQRAKFFLISEFTDEFEEEFGLAGGKIDWTSLMKFVSSGHSVNAFDEGNLLVRRMIKKER
jgi:hypothetical protein